MTINCWEFKQCGRQPGGARTAEMGICPASTLEAANGFLGGRNGGRACAYITGTFCSGMIEGTYREKAKGCEYCDFFAKVRKEEGGACSILSFIAHVRGRDQHVHDKLVSENAGLPGIPSHR